MDYIPTRRLGSQRGRHLLGPLLAADERLRARLPQHQAPLHHPRLGGGVRGRKGCGRARGGPAAALAVSNLGFWAFGLFGLLHAVYLPRAFKGHYNDNTTTKLKD